MRQSKAPFWLSLIFAASLATWAAADEASPLSWKEAPPRLRRPAADQRYYPEVAKLLGLNGKATVVCRVAASGDLSDCAIKAEEPAGWGFAQALLGMASSMRVPLKAKDGSGTAGRSYVLPCNFRMPGEVDFSKARLPRADAGAVELARRLPYLTTLSDAIEADLRSSARRIETPAGPVLVPDDPSGLSGALGRAVEEKHADLLEALAVAYAASMSQDELQAALDGKSRLDLSSPKAIEKTRAVMNMVVPWYRAQVFAEMRRTLPSSKPTSP